ncbi:lipid II flippase MurJ, partial [[Clostridium] dakarense]|uniref:lipid II flippase MurJ n=1 Tax=Faecalimicrobium dakarense TaxID=1301100 RepID=UPI0024187D48
NRFNIPGLTGLPYNILIIISIILSIKINILILPIGLLVAALSQFLFQFPFAYKEGYIYKPYINIKDEYLKKAMYLLLPVVIGVGVNQINIVVDKSLASTLGDGIITILNSANRLNDFVQGLFIVTITTVMYPLLSNLSSIGKNEEFKQNIKKMH